MALDELLAIVEADAQAAMDAVVQEARRRGKNVVAAVEARARRNREEALERETFRVREELAPSLARARLRARRRVSEARRRLAARVFEEIERRIPESVTQEDYRQSLAQELELCLSYFGDEPLIVRAAASVSSLMERLARGRGEVETDPTIRSGFRIEGRDGAIAVDQTLETTVARMRPELEIELFRLWESEREATLG